MPTRPLSLGQRLADEVSEAARQLPGVTSAYVSPDGAGFWLLGPQWTAELSEAGAELAVRLQHALAPDFQPYIDGGFDDAASPPPTDAPAHPASATVLTAEARAIMRFTARPITFVPRSRR